MHLLNSHHPVRLPCALSHPKNFAYRGPYRTIGAARMYRSLSKQGSFTEFSYDQRIPATSPHTLTCSLFSFLGRIRQGCQLSTYTEIPTLTAAQCNSRRLARRRDRKGRWQRHLCSSLQTTLTSSSFLAHRPPVFLCQPNHTQKRRSLTRLPRFAHDGGTKNGDELKTTITSHYLTTIILFGPCIRVQVAPLDPSGLGLKGKVPLGL